MKIAILTLFLLAGCGGGSADEAGESRFKCVREKTCAQSVGGGYK